MIFRRTICDLQANSEKIEQHIISTLKAEVSGPVICSLNSLLPQLKKLKACEQHLDEDLESWAVSKSQLVEYHALWQVIAENRPTWDIVDELEESPGLMRELVELQLKVSVLFNDFGLFSIKSYVSCSLQSNCFLDTR